jgi:hypothetical protein
MGSALNPAVGAASASKKALARSVRLRFAKAAPLDRMASRSLGPLREEKMDHAAEVKKYAPNADQAKVDSLLKYLSIALRNPDSALVASSDPDELKTVHNNWAKKKLGVTDDAAIDAAIKTVVEKMKGNNHKSRAAFYYLVAEALGKLDAV